MAKFSVMDTLNEQSKFLQAKEVEQKDQSNNKGASFAIDIPINKIIIAKHNKNKYGIRDIEELAADIEEFGLMHNIVVNAADENGNYELISGERRWRAYNLLSQKDSEKYKSIPCKVENHGNSLVQELRLIQANATARVLTDYEKTMQASRIKEILQGLRKDGYKFKGRMRDIVAEILKVSSAQMGRMESIDKNLLDDFKNEFKEGNIGITNAYDISRKGQEEQKAAYEDYKKTGEIKKEEPIKQASITHAPNAEEEEEEEKEGQGCVSFLNINKQTVEIYGDLIFIVGVDKQEDIFDVAFPYSKNVKSLDYATLAQVVILECIKGIKKDKESLKAMQNGIESIFKKMGN